MPDNFLQLPSHEQAQIFNELSRELGRAPVILEKDVWVCWTLEQLFSMPDRLKMVFKGGTSLSKAFNVIQRFSEDIDITIDHRDFNNTFNPFGENISKSQLKKFSEQLKLHVKHYTHEKVVPYLKNQLELQFPKKTTNIEINENGEAVRIHYSSVIKDINNYIPASVLLEFGGRNSIEPNEPHSIQPDIAKILPNLRFPTAKVNVLSATRTFWEKATLIHVACNQDQWKDSLERKSRHWYDLAMLAESTIGQKALLEKEILADVVKYKNVFFYYPHADYAACLTGKIKLVPHDNIMLEGLQTDFEKMLASGMFYEKQPVFNDIIHALSLLEETINNST
jgi:hypothetical protein